MLLFQSPLPHICLSQIQNDVPYFQRFAKGWCIRDVARIYLSNEQTRRRADMQAEANEHKLSDVEESDSDSEIPARRKAPKKSKVHKGSKPQVRFAQSQTTRTTDDKDVEDSPAPPKSKVFYLSLYLLSRSFPVRNVPRYWRMTMQKWRMSRKKRDPR